VQVEVFGRQREQTQLLAALRLAGEGEAQSLLLMGDPGIGKTTLLDWVAGRATRWQVRRARGHEADAATSYLVLRELLGQFVRDAAADDSGVDALFEQLGAAIEFRSEGASVERLGLAALNLLGACSELSPVLLIVDDAHVADRASLSVLTFVARRSSHERLLVLFASRPFTMAGAGVDRELFGDIVDLRLEGLDESSADELVRHGDRRLTTAQMTLCGGNPLALQHLADESNDDQSLPERLQRAFARQIDRLSERTRHALGLLALVGAVDGDLLDDALARLGCERRDFGEALDAGVVSINGDFVHPLMRAAASSIAPIDCHHALAASLEDRGLGERALWHRLVASDGSDPTLADDAERIAGERMGSGRWDEAERWFEHVVRLTSRPEQRFSALRNAALSLAYSSRYRDAAVLFDRALVVAPTPSNRLVALRSAPWCRLWAGATVADAAQPLAEALQRSPSSVEDSAAGAAHGSLIALYTQHNIFLAAAAALAAEGFESVETDVLVAMLLANDPRVLKMTERLTSRALSAASFDLNRLEFSLAVYGGLMLLAGEFAEAEVACARYAEMVRQQSLESEVGPAASRWMVAKVFVGALVDAYGLALSAIERQPDDMALLTSSAFVGAVVGEPRAEEWATRALQQSEPRALHSISLEAHHRLGLIEWSRGRLDAAAEHFDRCWQLLTDFGFRCPAHAHARGDIAAAYARLGRTADARRVINELELGVLPSKWATGVAARARGILGEPDGFRTACDALADSPWELARTHYEMACSGERDEVIVGLPARFASLGARPWAALAERALDDGPPSHSHDPLAGLSDRERSVALVVARGLSNKETAAELFISAKTVDAHLQQIYRKLAVRSRSELTARCYGAVAI
jgi:DNA-binding CsgD family transcriptional regulator